MTNNTLKVFSLVLLDAMYTTIFYPSVCSLQALDCSEDILVQ